MNVFFTFPEGGLDEVSLEPLDALVTDVRHIFVEQYGNPLSELPFPDMLGKAERYTVWRGHGYEVELTQNDNGGGSISFRRSRMTAPAT